MHVLILLTDSLGSWILCKMIGDTEVQLTSSACVSAREELVTLMQSAGSCHIWRYCELVDDGLATAALVASASFGNG